MSMHPGNIKIIKTIDVQSNEDRVARNSRMQGFAEGLFAAAALVLAIKDDANSRMIRRAILDLIKEKHP